MSANNQLICPSCQRTLIQVRMSHGIFWSCENCGGRAVGVELLRRTFTPQSINPLWLHAIKSEGQSGRRCPSCRNSMIEVKLSDTAEIKVDVCRLCHFVWFDAKEVETLVPRAAAPPKPEMPQKAREATAMLEIERLANEARRSDYDFDIAPPDEWWKQIAAFLGV
jgi:Zn-finger nucleic acid-binding protein